jgi:hypothetical protein
MHKIEYGGPRCRLTRTCRDQNGFEWIDIHGNDNLWQYRPNHIRYPLGYRLHRAGLDDDTKRDDKGGHSINSLLSPRYNRSYKWLPVIAPASFYWFASMADIDVPLSGDDDPILLQSPHPHERASSYMSKLHASLSIFEKVTKYVSYQDGWPRVWQLVVTKWDIFAAKMLKPPRIDSDSSGNSKSIADIRHMLIQQFPDAAIEAVASHNSMVKWRLQEGIAPLRVSLETVPTKTSIWPHEWPARWSDAKGASIELIQDIWIGMTQLWPNRSGNMGDPIIRVTRLDIMHDEPVWQMIVDDHCQNNVNSLCSPSINQSINSYVPNHHPHCCVWISIASYNVSASVRARVGGIHELEARASKLPPRLSCFS